MNENKMIEVMCQVSGVSRSDKCLLFILQMMLVGFWGFGVLGFFEII